MGFKFKQVLEAKKHLDDRLSRLLILEAYKDLNLQQMEALIDIVLPYGYYTEWQKYIYTLINYYLTNYKKVGNPELVAKLEEAGTYIEREKIRA